MFAVVIVISSDGYVVVVMDALDLDSGYCCVYSWDLMLRWQCWGRGCLEQVPGIYPSV